jgi:hypothetical protein
MKRATLFAVLLVLASSASAQLPTQLSTQDCDRDCLRATVTQYLDALVKHEPALLPLAPAVRFTEDHNALALGEGQWQSIERLGTFRQDILDPQTGTAGVHVLAYESGMPVLIATRLKVAGGQITEIESSVVRSREEGMIFNPDAITTASAAMNFTPPADQRNTREELVRLALLYPEGLRVGSFVKADAQFATEAYRFENGQLMAGPECTFLPGCNNIREQGLPTLAGIQAKVAAVDEELGIVWLRMNFGPGSLFNGDGELSVWEMFKIYDGKIQAVEAFMEEVPASTPFGWEY